MPLLPASPFPARDGRVRRRPLPGLPALLLLCTPAAAQVDAVRLAPPTGVYVETGPGNSTDGCDWYFAADALAALPAGDAPGGGCAIDIRLRGLLNRDGARRFRQAVDWLEDSAHVPLRVVLNSRGGDSQAAFYIAGLIREHAVFRRPNGGVTTTVDRAAGAVCFSACLIVFAAGERRIAEFDETAATAWPSRLGIHGARHYDPRRGRHDSSGGNRNIRIVRQQLVRYFTRAGISAELVDAMFDVPFDEIRLLTRAEAEGWGLVTAAE